MQPLVMRTTKSAKNMSNLARLTGLKTLAQPLELQQMCHQLCVVELVAVVQHDHLLVTSLEHQEADHGWH
jgi:hypothetical protein